MNQYTTSTRSMYPERESDGKFAPIFRGKAGWKKDQEYDQRRRETRERNQQAEEKYGLAPGDKIFA